MSENWLWFESGTYGQSGKTLDHGNDVIVYRLRNSDKTQSFAVSIVIEVQLLVSSIHLCIKMFGDYHMLYSGCCLA